jgi:hypothetical protein
MKLLRKKAVGWLFAGGLVASNKLKCMDKLGNPPLKNSSDEE